MTPEETAALVRAALAALNARDFERWRALLHPDVEIRSRIVRSAGDDWFRGYAGAREWWEAIARTYDEADFGADEVVVAGDRAVIRVRARFVVRGVAVEHAAWQAARFQDRRFRVWARYETEEEARARAGIGSGAGVRIAFRSGHA
jgi:ketosteroid isomerase-like protein